MPLGAKGCDCPRAVVGLNATFLARTGHRAAKEPQRCHSGLLMADRAGRQPIRGTWSAKLACGSKVAQGIRVLQRIYLEAAVPFHDMSPTLRSHNHRSKVSFQYSLNNTVQSLYQGKGTVRNSKARRRRRRKQHCNLNIAQCSETRFPGRQAPQIRKRDRQMPIWATARSPTTRRATIPSRAPAPAQRPLPSPNQNRNRNRLCPR
jgi:hypothetical protein